MSLRVVARPYLWLRHRLAEGGAGNAFDRLSVWSDHSAFGRGRWTRLVGASLLGIACGSAIDRALLVPILSGLVGLIMVVWGPRLLVMFRTSAVVRGLWCLDDAVGPRGQEEREDGKARPVFGLGVGICAASGVVAGLVGRPGIMWLVGGAVAAAVVVVLLWRPEAILLAVAAFPWFDHYAREIFGGIGAAWDEGLLLLCAVLLLWSAVVTGRHRLRSVPIAFPMMVALVAAVGSIVVRGVPTATGLFALRVVFEPLLFYFAGFLFFTSPQWVRRIVVVFLASTTALALHGLYQYATRLETPTRWVAPGEAEDIVTRAFSVIGNPNGLGTVLAIGIVVTVALLLSPGRSRLSRVALVAVVALQTAGLAVTFSRGAWIALACGLVALLVLAYRRYLIALAAIGVAAIIAAPDVFVNRFRLIFDDTYRINDALWGRTYRWNAAQDHIAANPWFGRGLGTWGGSAAERHGHWATWVDNYYLQMGAEGGLLLLAAFVWVLLRVAKGLVKAAKAATDSFERALAAGVCGGLVAVAIANVFASVFETLAVGAAFWLLAGVATSAGMNRTTESQ